jgi:oligopeptide/dipeptide ABC transporter ATP-binding protein
MTTQSYTTPPEDSVGNADGQVSLLEVRDLQTHFSTRWGIGKAVDGVSFAINKGETVGLVGESGSGKSMTALSILGLVPKSGGRIVGGEVLFEGRNLVGLPPGEMRKYRGRRLSMIPQDPLTTLNPVFTIGNQVAEPLRIHHLVPESGVVGRVLQWLRAVHIPDPESRLNSYPHQFSGGMRQRVVGATTFSAEPMLLIADEPTTSLDVTIQAQYLRLLKEIQARTNVAILFITHDMGIVANMCDRVAVMYAGRIVEEAPVRRLFEAPSHPYTEALLDSIPTLTGARGRLTSIKGEPPDLYDLPQGCYFAPRCTKVMDICRTEYPPTIAVEGEDQRAACWLLVKGHHESRAADAH